MIDYILIFEKSIVIYDLYLHSDILRIEKIIDSNYLDNLIDLENDQKVNDFFNHEFVM